MNQFFSISSVPLKIAFLVCYLFAAVFGIGVHAHETLSHLHDAAGEHEHHFVVHVHNDVGASSSMPVPAVDGDDHNHRVATVQFSSVQNPTSNKNLLPCSANAACSTIEQCRVLRADYSIAIVRADTSPPLLSYEKSTHIGRGPPTA